MPRKWGGVRCFLLSLQAPLMTHDAGHWGPCIVMNNPCLSSKGRRTYHVLVFFAWTPSSGTTPSGPPGQTPHLPTPLYLPPPLPLLTNMAWTDNRGGGARWPLDMGAGARAGRLYLEEVEWVFFWLEIPGMDKVPLLPYPLVSCAGYSPSLLSTKIRGR